MLLCWCQTSSSPPLESLRSVCTPCCCSAQIPASSHDSLSDAACTRLHISVMCLAFSSLAQIIHVPWLRSALHTCSQARGYLVNNMYDPAQGGSQQGSVAIVPWIARVQGHRLADNILHSTASFHSQQHCNTECLTCVPHQSCAALIEKSSGSEKWWAQSSHRKDRPCSASKGMKRSWHSRRCSLNDFCFVLFGPYLKVGVSHNVVIPVAVNKVGVGCLVRPCMHKNPHLNFLLSNSTHNHFAQQHMVTCTGMNLECLMTVNMQQA